MKTLEKYQCEICNTEYKDKYIAKKCENSHKKALEISDVRYLPLSQNGNGYPTTVTIKMSDGKQIIYKR